MKRFFYFFIFLTILIISSNFVWAIGISPAIIETKYVEGKTESFNYHIINKANKQTKINMMVDKALSEYASISPEEFILDANSEKLITVTIKYPPYSKLTSYGVQRLFVRATEVPISPLAGWAAVTSVVGDLRIDIPRPGEFATIKSIEIPSVEKGQDTYFKVILANKGTDPLANKNAQVTLYSPTGEKEETFPFRNINIPVDGTFELAEVIQSKEYVEGKYSADVSFDFSNEHEPAYKKIDFFIGSTDIILDSYEDTLIRGQINKIALKFQSIWGSPLQNVRTELIIDGKSEKLPILDFEPFGKTTINAHPDISEKAPDYLTGQLKIEVPTATDVKEKIVELKFSVVDSGEIIVPEEPGDTENKYMLLIVSVIVLILLLVALNIYLLTKSRKKDKNEK